MAAKGAELSSLCLRLESCQSFLEFSADHLVEVEIRRLVQKAVVLTAVVILLVFVSTRPDEFRIARKVTIKASPEVIFPLVDDLRRFNEWNPFAKADPAIKLAYGATSAGPGGSYNWHSTGGVAGGLALRCAQRTVDLLFFTPLGTGFTFSAR